MPALLTTIDGVPTSLAQRSRAADQRGPVADVAGQRAEPLSGAALNRGEPLRRFCLRQVEADYRRPRVHQRLTPERTQPPEGPADNRHPAL